MLVSLIFIAFSPWFCRRRTRPLIFLHGFQFEASVRPRQKLFQLFQELRPTHLGAAIGALLVGPEQKWLTTEGFLDKIDQNLKRAMM